MGWFTGKKDGYGYEAKVYDEKSKHGINGGRVSKLSLTDKNNKTVVNYDRGWDVSPKGRKSNKAVKSILSIFDD